MDEYIRIQYKNYNFYIYPNNCQIEIFRDEKFVEVWNEENLKMCFLEVYCVLIEEFKNL